jgi:hypothetical protein
MAKQRESEENIETLPDTIEAAVPAAAAGARYCSADGDCIVIDGPWRRHLES